MNNWNDSDFARFDAANKLCREACQFGSDAAPPPPPPITPELQAAWLICTQPDVMFDLLETLDADADTLGDAMAEMLMATDWHMTPERPEPGSEHFAGANAIRKIVPALVAR
jgi:hypothetical protein